MNLAENRSKLSFDELCEKIAQGKATPSEMEEAYKWGGHWVVPNVSFGKKGLEPQHSSWSI